MITLNTIKSKHASSTQDRLKSLYLKVSKVLKMLIVLLRRLEKYLDFVRSLDTSFLFPYFVDKYDLTVLNNQKH